MNYSLEVIRRSLSASDYVKHAQVLLWLGDQMANRWWTLGEMLGFTPLYDVDSLSRLMNAYLEKGWVETKVEDGRLLWKASDMLPDVRRANDHQGAIERVPEYAAVCEKAAFGQFFSAVLHITGK